MEKEISMKKFFFSPWLQFLNYCGVNGFGGYTKGWFAISWMVSRGQFQFDTPFNHYYATLSAVMLAWNFRQGTCLESGL